MQRTAAASREHRQPIVLEQLEARRLLSGPLEPATPKTLTDLDELVNVNSVRRLEVYHRGANPPAEFPAGRECGVLAVWSAWEDRKFEQRLRYHGFSVEMQRVRARLKKGGPRHTIFLGVKPARAITFSSF